MVRGGSDKECKEAERKSDTKQMQTWVRRTNANLGVRGGWRSLFISSPIIKPTEYNTKQQWTKYNKKHCVCNFLL